MEAEAKWNHWTSALETDEWKGSTTIKKLRCGTAGCSLKLTPKQPERVIHTYIIHTYIYMDHCGMDDQKYTMSLDIRIWQWSSQTLSSKVWVLSGLRTFRPRFWLTNRWVQVVCMVRRCDCHRIEMRWVYLQKYTYHIIMNNNELYIYTYIYIYLSVPARSLLGYV